MKATQIVLNVLLICLLQTLPVFSTHADSSEADAITYDTIFEYSEEIIKGLIWNFDSPAHTIIKEIYRNVTNQFDREIVELIFAKAVDEITSREHLLKLADFLSHINEAGDWELLEIMLHAPWQVYRFIGVGEDRQKYEFLQKLSYILYKIQKNSMYATRAESFKTSVEDIITGLPGNFLWPFFRKQYCMSSAKYENLYIGLQTNTSAFNETGSNNGSIRLWVGIAKFDNTSLISSEFEEVDVPGRKKLQVILQGTESKAYYALDPATKAVFGSHESINNKWSMEYFDKDRIVFSQGDFKMCVADDIDGSGLTVKGRAGVPSTKSECQWRMIDCKYGYPLL